MKFNFKGNQLLNNLVGSSLNEVDDNIMCKTVCLLIIIYIILIVPQMLNQSSNLTNNIVSLSNNTLFKLLIYLIIGLVAESNMQLALFLVIALNVTENTIIKYEFNQNILDFIIKDQQTKKNSSTKSNIVEKLRVGSKPAPYVRHKKIKKKIKKELSRMESSKKELSRIDSPKIESPKIESPKIESPKIQTSNTQSPSIKKIENDYESFNNNDNNNFSYLE